MDVPVNTAETPASEDAGGDLARIARWTIAVVQPPGYTHSGAMMEVAETLVYALRRLGRQADLNVGLANVGQGGLVVLGAHLLPAADALPPHAVIYNMEQLVAWEQGHARRNAKVATDFFDRLMRHRVWDYCEANVRWLRERGHQRAERLPLGYVPELSRVPARGAPDVDVLFYGCPNPRRTRILDALRTRGLRVETLFGVYGQARDAWIGRAKVVLNMHFYESKLFEIVRVSYLLANRKAVVCEEAVMDEDDAPLREGMAYVPYDGLVDACEALARDDARRAHLERRGYELFSQRDATRLMAELLGLPTAKPGENDTPQLPDTLHLGSGKDFRADCFNVDIDPGWGPDLALDFSAPLPWGQPLATARFGEIRLQENQFEQIVTNDVLEHIPNLVQAMSNALRLLRPGGVFVISVPYDLSLGAWQDPTHVRAFNENSWLYYTDWFWYLGWAEARFDVLRSGATLSGYGQQLAAQGHDLSVIMRTPRGVDSLQVVLRKRYLTPAESLLLQQKRAPTKHAPRA